MSSPTRSPLSLPSVDCLWRIWCPVGPEIHPFIILIYLILLWDPLNPFCGYRPKASPNVESPAAEGRSPRDGLKSTVWGVSTNPIVSFISIPATQMDVFTWPATLQFNALQLQVKYITDFCRMSFLSFLLGGGSSEDILYRGHFTLAPLSPAVLINHGGTVWTLCSRHKFTKGSRTPRTFLNTKCILSRWNMLHVNRTPPLSFSKPSLQLVSNFFGFMFL